MKILMVSYHFFPSVGGLETVSMLLASEFAQRGHDVVVVTRTEAHGPDGFPFRVVRNPAPVELVSLSRRSDLFFHNNIALSLAWPLLLVRRPWVVAHHNWIPSDGTGWRALKGRMKRAFLRFARSISISDAIAASLPVPSVVIPDPYDNQVFSVRTATDRSEDLVFVGRLVSDKGVDDLIHALSALGKRGLRPTLTIVGGGPEEKALRSLVATLGIDSQVHFASVLRREQLAAVLSTHRILVVPSRWNEPFGVVALEGIACGCVVVGSSGGGLKDAIGPCGMTFPNGDVVGLADCLETLLRNPERIAAYSRFAPDHLAKHSPGAVAGAYLEVMEAAIEGRGYGAAD